MTRYRCYTGVGSRRTPQAIQETMEGMAQTLARHGFTLRTGAAEGADLAFENGSRVAAGREEVFIPWDGFSARSIDEPGVFALEQFDHGLIRRAAEIARELHPAWHNMSRASKKLHARNVQQVLGPTLKHPSLFVICYTPGGRCVGGTATAIKVALANSIPVFNLGAREWTLREIAESVLSRRERERERAT